MPDDEKQDDKELRFPGKDPDPEGSYETRIKAGWALIGILSSCGLLGYFLQHLGLSLLPNKPTMLDYSRLAAFAVSCLNILIWMWFPLDDLNILRKWLRTKKAIFPCHTSEFFAILLATVLLLLLILASVVRPLYFALAGTVVYLWNFVGFSIIRNKIQRAMPESRRICAELAAERSVVLNGVLDVLESHWSCAPSTHWLFNKQQIRHGLLTLSFLTMTSISLLGHGRIVGTFIYIGGIVTIVVAEVLIALWRNRRDHALSSLVEQLRAIPYEPNHEEVSRVSTP